MFLIHLIHQHPHRGTVDQIHIIVPASALPGGKEHKQPVGSLWQVKIYKTIFTVFSQIQDALPIHCQTLSVRLWHRQDSQQLLIGEMTDLHIPPQRCAVYSTKVLHQHSPTPAGSADIHMAFRQVELTLTWLSLKAAVCMSCGEFVIVQDP